MAKVSVFTGVLFNGADLSDSAVVRAVANRFCEVADRHFYSDWAYDLHEVGYSLFSLCDEVEGVTARLKAWLADPANECSPEYSDVFKDVYGFRPRW